MSTRSAVASAQLARLTVAGHRATCSPSPALPRTGSPCRWSTSQRHTFRSVCVRPLQPSPWGRVGTGLPRGQERVPPSERNRRLSPYCALHFPVGTFPGRELSSMKLIMTLHTENLKVARKLCRSFSLLKKQWLTSTIKLQNRCTLRQRPFHLPAAYPRIDLTSLIQTDPQRFWITGRLSLV